MKYINRQGVVYYLFQGTTKTGKPKYYVSRSEKSDSGVQIDCLPVDFELHESPVDGRVSVRRKVPSDIFANELQFVKERTKATVRKLSTQVVCEGKFIVIYESGGKDPFHSTSEDFDMFYSPLVASMQSRGPMSPALRFKLVNKKDRTFEAERYCYRSYADGWISLHHAGSLDELCQAYLKHLGKESFFELV